MGGANRTCDTTGLTAKGASPRGRGKRPNEWRRRWAERSIPAWAGQTQAGSTRFRLDREHPRVGGANGYLMARKCTALGASPRGRGKPTELVEGAEDAGSIPAWAGQTGWAGPGRSLSWEHPRVGGANPATMCQSGAIMASSCIHCFPAWMRVDQSRRPCTECSSPPSIHTRYGPSASAAGWRSMLFRADRIDSPSIF